ncbi:hypothetical protein Tco_1501912 [Tanacetum coccineum]
MQRLWALAVLKLRTSAYLGNENGDTLRIQMLYGARFLRSSVVDVLGSGFLGELRDEWKLAYLLFKWIGIGDVVMKKAGG